MLTQFLRSRASVLQHLSIYVLHDGHVSKSTCEIRWLTQNLGHWQHVERGCSKKRRDVIIKKLHEFNDNSVEIWTAREQTVGRWCCCRGRTCLTTNSNKAHNCSCHAVTDVVCLVYMLRRYTNKRSQSVNCCRHKMSSRWGTCRCTRMLVD